MQLPDYAHEYFSCHELGLIIVNLLWDGTKESSGRALSAAIGIILGFLLHRHVILLLANELGLSL
jgi:hypothetical protein